MFLYLIQDTFLLTEIGHHQMDTLKALEIIQGLGLLIVIMVILRDFGQTIPLIAQLVRLLDFITFLKMENLIKLPYLII